MVVKFEPSRVAKGPVSPLLQTTCRCVFLRGTKGVPRNGVGASVNMRV